MPTTTSFTTTRDQAGPAFTVTDWTQDVTLDCDSDDADLGDVLGTVIKQLIDKGILVGTVTTKA